jgi:hypothetical protein
MPVMRTTRTLLALSLATTAAGCDLGVDPTTSVLPDVATENISGVGSILTTAYARLQDADLYGMELLLLPELMADNARTSQPAVNRVAEFQNSLGTHMGDWATSYQAINEVNYVLASAEALVGAEPTLANRYIGEALYLRALFYFDLARVFAYEPGRYVNSWDVGVVVRTEPTRTVVDAEPRERAKVEEVYQQIESDLLAAIPLLEQYGEKNLYRASQASAEALLAKVYLYWQKWSDVVTRATAALSHTTAKLAEPNEVAGMFAKAPNGESLFEINYDAATETLWVNDCAACFTWPSGTWFSIWPSAELLALFAAGDARLALYPSTATGIRYVNKYTYARGSWTDNSPVIRYADVLLMRAEANAELGQFAAAQNDLNLLRAKRSAEPITATGAALVAAILDERRRELAFEGQRWFDLKRRGQDITKPAFGNNATVLYSDARILAPLPNNQVQNNALLTQNPGY